MTKRERYLRALRGEAFPELVWAPNFDYWLNVNTAEGTLPEKYAGMSRNDIVRAVGGTIWNRAGGIDLRLDPSVRRETASSGRATVTTLHTPVGSVSQTSRVADGARRSPAVTEHFVKTAEDIRVMKYVAEATAYLPTPDRVKKALDETGEDGVVLTSAFCVPFIQFAKTDAGYVNGIYLWTDEREAVDGLLEVYFRKFLEGIAAMAQTPTDMIAIGDNMDGVTVSPPIFREYALPFYAEARKAAGGKILQAHWCGRTETLLEFVPGSGLDSVEAIVPRPMSSISLSQALDRLGGAVTLQGGIPAVMVCPGGGSREDFEAYIRREILPNRSRPGFILGMSDNVPPNADFSRVEAVAELIKE